MVGTRLLYESDTDSRLGRVSLVGTGSGTDAIRHRVMHAYAWVYVAAGDGYYRDDLGTAQRLRRGDTVTVFPGLGHSYGAVPGHTWEQIYFVFDGPAFTLLEASGLFDRTMPVRRVEPVTSWVERCLRFADRPRPSNEAECMATVGALVQLVTEAFASSPRSRAWLARARALLEHDISQPLDLGSVATELDMTYEAFRRRFRREAGEPPAHYRARRRTLTAAELLSSTSLSLSQIAATLGYSDAYHLSKRFKAAAGVSPREYRHGLRTDPRLGSSRSAQAENRLARADRVE